ncbi:hypothetical protein Tco_1133412 [Tanacetum coccineum]
MSSKGSRLMVNGDDFLDGWVGAGGGVVKGGGVVFGVVRNSLGEKPGGARGVFGGESRGVEGEDLGMLMIKIWLKNGDGEAMENKDIYRESHAWNLMQNLLILAKFND